MERIDLGSLAAVMLAISIATERLVTIAKTIFPHWLANERKTDAKEVDLYADRGRRLKVQAIAFMAAWITVTFLAENRHPFGFVAVGGLDLFVPWAALLASGGSALWSQIVGYSSALKDVAQVRRATAGLAFTEQALELGVSPLDTGKVARPPEDRSPHGRVEAALQRAVREGGEDRQRFVRTLVESLQAESGHLRGSVSTLRPPSLLSRESGFRPPMTALLEDGRFVDATYDLAQLALRQPEVLGGTPVLNNDFPDCVALGGASWGCSGVLIAPDAVLSAAHCGSHYANWVWFGPRIGTGEAIRVARTHFHPPFQGEGGPAPDLMILRLERPLLNVSPRRICPSAVIDAASFGLVVGFGHTNPAGTAGYGVKRAGWVPIVSARCAGQSNGEHDSVRYRCIPGREIVAGVPGFGVGACTGDSGGPLYISDASGEPLLAGITSRSIFRPQFPCGDGAIFVRVDTHFDWIRSILGAFL